MDSVDCLKMVCLSLCIGVNAQAETVVNDATLTEVGDGSNWPGFGRNYSEQRYSPLSQILSLIHISEPTRPY